MRSPGPLRSPLASVLRAYRDPADCDGLHTVHAWHKAGYYCDVWPVFRRSAARERTVLDVLARGGAEVIIDSDGHGC